MKKIIYISQSALASSGCIEKFYKTVVEGYKEPAFSANIVYGIAVAKYIDTMYKTKGNGIQAIRDAMVSFRVPKVSQEKKPWLSDERHFNNLCGTLWAGYIENEPNFEILEFNGVPATEFTFDIPIWEDEQFEIHLAGTMDKLGQFKGGCFAVGDNKTTSSWDKRGYLKQYEMSKQLLLYTLACKLEARDHPESVMGRIGSQKMGAFIDAIFIKEQASDVEMLRSEVFQYTDKQVWDFHGSVITFIETRLVPALYNGHGYKEGLLTGTCQGNYGFVCPFWNVCKSSQAIADLLLRRDFVQKTFDPLHYND